MDWRNLAYIPYFAPRLVFSPILVPRTALAHTYTLSARHKKPLLAKVGALYATLARYLLSLADGLHIGALRKIPVFLHCKAPHLYIFPTIPPISGIKPQSRLHSLYSTKLAIVDKLTPVIRTHCPIPFSCTVSVRFFCLVCVLDSKVSRYKVGSIYPLYVSRR